jgi:predicted amidophosphoribosyltransferase
MVACGFCGHDNDSGVRFCGQCGKPLRASAARVQSAYTPAGGVRPPVSAGSSASETVAEGQHCRKCGSSVDASEPFCAHCGTKVVDKVEVGACAECGSTYARGVDLFCSRCGYRVGERVSIQTKIIGSNMRASGARLALLDERGEPSKIFTLDRGEAVVGRGEADIKFEFDVYLSPLHARIDLKEGQLWLRDLGSRNGSWVFIDEATKLMDGDLILIGSQMLRFRRLGYPGPHPPEADSTRRMGSVVPPVDVAVLEQLRADESVRDSFHLSPSRNVILGRTDGDWIFPYDQTMSGKHAEIVSEDIEFFVRDAGSRNGVAMAVRGDREIKKTQRILLGDQILRVENV